MAKKAVAKKAPQKIQAKIQAKSQQKTAKTKPKTKVKASPKSVKKSPKKTAPKSVKKSEARAPKTAPARPAGVVGQAVQAFREVASRVTNAFSGEGSSGKKKVLTKIDLENVFSPLDDRLVIQRTNAPDRTPGGLYIPDSAAGGEKSNRGIVVAVGPGHRDKKGRLRPLDVQRGDTVLFDRYVGNEIKIDGEDLLLLRETEIVAIVK